MSKPITKARPPPPLLRVGITRRCIRGRSHTQAQASAASRLSNTFVKHNYKVFIRILSRPLHFYLVNTYQLNSNNILLKPKNG